MEEINKLVPQYVMKMIVLDKKSINLFDINIENRRKIRGGKVDDLLKGLKNGIHFSSPFVVNDKSGRYFLIDGNHRFEAVKLAIKQDENFLIKIWTAVYKDLTKEEERKIYKLWNIGVPQTATDFLKAYFKTIPFGSEMLRRLPVTIYGDKTHLPLKPLMGSHIAAKKQGNFNTYAGSKEQVISDFSDITSEDIDVVFEFCSFMEKTFGKFYQGNHFYRTTPISAFYRIWYDNRDMKEELIIKCFKKVFASYPEKWDDWTSHGGRTASATMYRVSLESLNDFSKRTPFLSDKDIMEGIDNRAKEKKKIHEILAIVHKK